MNRHQYPYNGQKRQFEINTPEGQSNLLQIQMMVCLTGQNLSGYWNLWQVIWLGNLLVDIIGKSGLLPSW